MILDEFLDHIPYALLRWSAFGVVLVVAAVLA